MTTKPIDCLTKLLPLAALMLACGIAYAVQPPRVMFVSGGDLKPVLVDEAGKETVAKKGQVIPPGYTVKVPEGATVQIMTDEKAIVAVRANSLLKLEKLGDGNEPHKFKLDSGGLRVANSEKKPHRFEVDTPNAKVTFDKGDHEAYYFKDGNKLTEGRWGTFVRGFKDESVLTTSDGDKRINKNVVGYVPGTSKDGKIEFIDRIKLTNVGLADPITSALTSDRASAVTDLNRNQQVLSEGTKSTSPDLVAPPTRSALTPPVAPGTFTVPKTIEPIVQPPVALSPISSLPTKTAMADLSKVAGISPVKTATLDQAVKPELSLQKDTATGNFVPVLKETSRVSVLATEPAKTTTIQIKDVPRTTTTVCLTCKTVSPR